MERVNLKKLKETDIWKLLEDSKSYCRMTNMFSDTDKNYRFYNGDQWNGLKLKGLEPVQLNFIKPIIKYKTGVLHSHLYAINYSSENYDDENFKETAKKTCELLNKKAAKIWEKDNLDLIIRDITKDAAVNSEGIIYVNYNDGEITNELIKKNNIFYGNENEPDIQKQPYILITQREPLITAIELAKEYNVKDLDLIIPDTRTEEESGESAKVEKDDMITIITKMWKENGIVYFSKSTRYVDWVVNEKSGTSLYPVAHFLWEEKEGSARGEGEVKYLIPNQIEVNKTEMRRILAVKSTAYPQKIVNMDKVVNPSSVNEVGGLIKVKGASVDDVQKAVAHINPAQMSPDAANLENELISKTRELANASDIATGQINPEQASGKAILAIQQASQQPITEQLIALRKFIEDLARIWLDLYTTFTKDKLVLEDEQEINVGEKEIITTDVRREVLQKLKTSVKVDITPKGAFDKYAQELSIENLLKAGFFNIEKLGELKAYANALDDDASMPKQKLLEIIKYQEEEQQRISIMEQNAQMMMQKANQFINSDLDSQAEQINDNLNQNYQTEETTEM